MIGRILLAALALPLPAAHAQVTAPSSLPGQAGSVPVLQAPPVAMPAPAYKPPKMPAPAAGSAPDSPYEPLPPGIHQPPTEKNLLDARKPKAISGEAAPVSPNPTLSLASPGKSFAQKRAPALREWVAYAPAARELKSEADPASPNTDSAKLNAQLETRYASAELDEADRAELKLDASQFAQLKSVGAASTPMQHPAATQRVMGAPGSGHTSNPPVGGGRIQTGTSAYLASQICEVHYKNQPRISRILPASDGQLVPGELFMLKGACFGSRPGTVEIRFGGTPARVYPARIVDWQPGKIQAAMPADITRTPPANVQVVVVTADARQAAPRGIAFWPRWEKVLLDPARTKNAVCHNELHYAQRAYCMGRGDPGPVLRGPFECPGKVEGHYCDFWGLATDIQSTHYTDETVIQPQFGEDRWSFGLPSYARIIGWGRADYRSRKPEHNGINIRIDHARQELVVRWHMADRGEEGYLSYNIGNIEAWMPVGIRP